MGSVHVEMSHWPIVIFTQEGEMGPEEAALLLTTLDGVLARKCRYATVFDSRKLSTFKMADRDRIVAWLKDKDALLRQLSAGTAVILSSAALRFVISSVLLVYRPAAPIKVFAELDPALAWAKEQLAMPQRAA